MILNTYFKDIILSKLRIYWSCRPCLYSINIFPILETNKLRFVKISFNTPTFDVITKDRAAKFTDMLSAIGGTLGLFTGFSIFGGVEILYYVLKILLHCIKRTVIKIVPLFNSVPQSKREPEAAWYCSKNLDSFIKISRCCALMSSKWMSERLVDNNKDF